MRVRHVNPIGDVALTPDEEFSAFYAGAHATVARAIGLTVGDQALGVEAADEAMARAYQRWDRIRAYDNPAGWTYRVGLNWSRSWLRRLHRRPEPDWVTDPPTPRDLDLHRALAALDEGQRSVVVCRYLLDWSVEDTAAALDLRPGTVKSRLHRALAQLEARLASEGE